MTFQQITIIGTGLIGGSFALAIRKAGFSGRIVGCDRESVLAQARQRGAVDEGFASPEQAVRGSKLILLAAPVGSIIDLVERVGPVADSDALLTDVGSTKTEIMARARDIFGIEVGQRFLAGHPMAGKENGGIDHADAELFRDAVWLISPFAKQSLEEPKIAAYLELVKDVGARVLEINAQEHDRICALVSHVPQMISTAFASMLVEELGNDPQASAIGGRALREMTRIAQSPYSMWRDIALTNTKNIQDGLLKLEQKLAHLRENLRTRQLEEEFEQAHRLRQPRKI